MFTVYYSDTGEIIDKTDTLVEAESAAFMANRAHRGKVRIEIINELSGDVAAAVEFEN